MNDLCRRQAIAYVFFQKTVSQICISLHPLLGCVTEPKCELIHAFYASYRPPGVLTSRRAAIYCVHCDGTSECMLQVERRACAGAPLDRADDACAWEPRRTDARLDAPNKPANRAWNFQNPAHSSRNEV
jgi:hypothetical protein